MQAWGNVLQGFVYALDQCPISVVVFHITSIGQESRGGNGVVPLTTTLSDSLAKVLLLVFMTLCSAGLETLVGMFLPGDTAMTPLTTTWILGAPHDLLS